MIAGMVKKDIVVAIEEGHAEYDKDKKKIAFTTVHKDGVDLGKMVYWMAKVGN
jgi:hypothetical protein